MLFLVNGLLIGSWAAKIPVFADRLSLDESTVGLMIVVFGLGALVTMPTTGVMIARFGTATVTNLLSIVAATTILWVTLAPDIWFAAISMFLFGGLIAGMDVAMNAVAIEVENENTTPIMSSCHGFWSLGGLIGAVLGGFILQHFDFYSHAVLVTVLCLAGVVIALPNLRSVREVERTESLKIEFPRTLLPYLIGLVALFSAMPEGAIIDWSALYLRQELGSSTFVSAIAFGAFSATMAIVRFVGDPIRARYGAKRTLRVCALVASTGLFVAALATTETIAILGFLIAGLGMSNLVPIAFSAAGNIPDQAPGIGISVATTIGYSGILVAPAAFGYLAEITSFGFVFLSLAFVLLLVLMLSNVVKYADMGHSE